MMCTSRSVRCSAILRPRLRLAPVMSAIWLVMVCLCRRVCAGKGAWRFLGIPEIGDTGIANPPDALIRLPNRLNLFAYRRGGATLCS